MGVRNGKKTNILRGRLISSGRKVPFEAAKRLVMDLVSERYYSAVPENALI